MTNRLAEFLTPDGGWSVHDLAGLPEDSRRRELVDGLLIMYPPPFAWHQTVMARLAAALDDTCSPGFHATMAVEVRVSDQHSYLPDVLVTHEAPGDRARFTPAEVLLAVEIVSEGSQSIDRVLKPALYAQAGIPYYWRIEVEGSLTVHTYKIDPIDNIYYSLGEFTDVIDVSQPWPIKMPIGRLTPKHLPPAG